MSKRVGQTIILKRERPRECSMCKQVKECRPYGPNGKDICFSCGQLIPEIRDHNLTILLFGEPGELK